MLWFVLFYLIWQITNNGPGFSTSITGSVEALKHIQEVSKWMAGVQVAMLTAAVTIMASKKVQIHPITGASTVVLLVSSLFSAGWVFTAILCITLRVHGEGSECLLPSKQFDVLNYPIYQQAPCYLDLNFFLTLQHWFWTASLLTFLHMISVAIVKEKIDSGL